MSSARWNVIASRTASGTSSRSGPLRAGRTTSVRPARWAASTFCFTPPMGSTRPDSVTSPVMPTVERTGRPVSRLTSSVVMVTPAAVLGRHGAGLDEQHVASGTGHGQAGGHPGHAGAVGRLVVEPGTAQGGGHVLGVDDDGLGLTARPACVIPAGDAGRRLAQQAPQLTLEAP